MYHGMSKIGSNAFRIDIVPLKKAVLLIFIGMCSLLPVYIFPAGGFNAADGPMLLIMGYILLTHRKSEILMQTDTLITLITFLFWAVWVNMITFLVSSPILCVIASVQMGYIVLLFITLIIFFFRALSDRSAIKYIYWGILLSAIIPLVMSGLSSGFKARQGLSFPNPNQLAYFAQIIIAAVLILNHFSKPYFPDLKNDKLIRATTIVILSLGHYYMLLSASRAGLAGVACLDLLALWKKKKLFLVAFISFTMFAFAMSYVSTDKIAGMKIYKRMMAGAYYTGLTERTEDRFNFEDLSLIFGGGKGNRSLDEKKVREFKEVHNTFGDVVYSYGMIGGVIFSLFIFFYLRTCTQLKFNVFVLLSFLPLHLTHNMIRFRLMWILYALVYSTCLLSRYSVNRNADSSKMVPNENPAIIQFNNVAPGSQKA